MDLYEELHSLVKTLNENNIDFAICGGIAVAFHGYSRFTKDIDFIVEKAVLEKIMDAILNAHQYEEPTIHLREEWASRAAYNPNNDNPNRWWNDGRGTPDMVEFG